MNRETLAAALIATALVMPGLAQDRPAAEAPKAEASQAKSKGSAHSHLEERQGIKLPKKSDKESKPMDKSKHSHPRDR